jgi:hypothetical protein
VAERNIKGILSRNSWDFYEYSASWGYVFAGSFAANSLFALINPGTQQGNLDVYRAEVCVSPGMQFYWFAFQSGATIPTSTGSGMQNNAIQTDQAQPLGLIGYWGSAWFSGQKIIRVRFDSPTYDSIEAIANGPFITLAPFWGLGCMPFGTVPSGVQLGFTVWWQVVLDNITQVK